MAFQTSDVNFMLNQIQNSGSANFPSVVTQLFLYFEREIKDNPVYNEYENYFKNVRIKISLNSDDDINVLSEYLPDNFEEAKMYSYAVYKEIKEDKFKDLLNYIYKFIATRSPSIQTWVDLFNQRFFGYLSKAVDDIRVVAINKINTNFRYEYFTEPVENRASVAQCHRHG